MVLNGTEKKSILRKDCDVSISRIVSLKVLYDLITTEAGAGLYGQKHPSTPRCHTTKQHSYSKLLPMIRFAYSTAFLN